MGKTSSNKRMTDVKFFIIVLIISVVIALGLAFVFSSGEDAPVPSLLVASLVISVYATLLRILMKANNPDNRLVNWKYFLALFVFVSGLLIIGGFLIGNEEGTIPLSLIVGFLVSSILSIVRWIKHRREVRKAEKERNQQYQEQLQRQNQQYADELKRKDRIISSLQSRSSESQESRRSSSSSYAPSSSSGYSRQYEEMQMERQREQMRRQEEEDRKKERLEDWYREYVTIEVDFEYHIKDSEYNQDYWDYRDEEIRVTRREAMALIEAGDGAILGRLGYGNWGNIRNFRYKVPYGLYDRPWNC